MSLVNEQSLVRPVVLPIQGVFAYARDLVLLNAQ